MPDLSKYDLDFRPKNYWDLRDVLTFVEAKITGKERKEIIKKEIQEGRRVPEELLKGSLDKNLRKLLGSMHPSFMGGESGKNNSEEGSNPNNNVITIK